MPRTRRGGSARRRRRATQAGAGGSLPVLSGLVGWWDANSEIYADGTAVGAAGTLLHDRSGGGFDLSQGAAGQRPTFKTAVANGKPVIRSVAANFSELVSGGMPLPAASPAELFIVLKPVNDPALAASGPIGIYVGGSMQYPTTTGMITDCFGTSSSNNIVNPAFSLSAAFSIYNASVALTAGGGQKFELNGTNVANFPAVAAIAWPASMRLCGNNDGWWSGDIAELIIYSRVLSVGERLNVTRYLGTKYGITVP